MYCPLFAVKLCFLWMLLKNQSEKGQIIYLLYHVIGLMLDA